MLALFQVDEDNNATEMVERLIYYPSTGWNRDRGLIAFHGSLAIKEKYLARIRAHVAADELIHGTGWKDGKGCAVGCTLNVYNHVAYEEELGIPMVLAYLEDNLFESMTNGESKTWPERFLQAIPVGADLSLVWPRFAYYLMQETAKVAGTSKEAVDAVGELYREWVETGVNPPQDRWNRAARSAAARAAAAAAAEAAAAQSQKLLELLAQAPVVGA